MLRGERYYGKKNDLFALGVMMLTLRTMNYPFTEAKANDREYTTL